MEKLLAALLFLFLVEGYANSSSVTETTVEKKLLDEISAGYHTDSTLHEAIKNSPAIVGNFVGHGCSCKESLLCFAIINNYINSTSEILSRRQSRELANETYCDASNDRTAPPLVSRGDLLMFAARYSNNSVFLEVASYMPKKIEHVSVETLKIYLISAIVGNKSENLKSILEIAPDLVVKDLLGNKQIMHALVRFVGRYGSPQFIDPFKEIVRDFYNRQRQNPAVLPVFNNFVMFESPCEIDGKSLHLDIGLGMWNLSKGSKVQILSEDGIQKAEIGSLACQSVQCGGTMAARLEGLPNDQVFGTLKNAVVWLGPQLPPGTRIRKFSSSKADCALPTNKYEHEGKLTPHCLLKRSPGAGQFSTINFGFYVSDYRYLEQGCEMVESFVRFPSQPEWQVSLPPIFEIDSHDQQYMLTQFVCGFGVPGISTEIWAGNEKGKIKRIFGVTTDGTPCG